MWDYVPRMAVDNFLRTAAERMTVRSRRDGAGERMRAYLKRHEPTCGSSNGLRFTSPRVRGEVGTHRQMRALAERQAGSAVLRSIGCNWRLIAAMSK
ncbi:hypothetical protein ACVIHI_002301 [Bradyrhizobium sp. USDA 4524]|nr:hypothetical protein [Bradyrhizobium sp. USDA 4538]MCP1905341.1 hypothetical protein [Bradyrhizobium sp. USDA 4537]MCP1989003.1 hypothetical protein [Bradyrhizobium sp. USDA 4539]